MIAVASTCKQLTLLFMRGQQVLASRIHDESLCHVQSLSPAPACLAHTNWETSLMCCLQRLLAELIDVCALVDMLLHSDGSVCVQITVNM